MSDFSNKCREYLKDTGENVYQLSASSGLDRTSLQRMITGKRLPGIDFVRQFCDSLRINPSQRRELMELYKIEKIGKDAVIEELEKIEVPTASINKILEFIEIEGTTDEKLQKLQNLGIENEAFKTGLDELTQVVKYVRLFGIPDSNFKVDLTIARGLDYYTGTVYETFLNEYRELGSVCSGGRYENLAEHYTDKSYQELEFLLD